MSSSQAALREMTIHTRAIRQKAFLSPGPGHVSSSCVPFANRSPLSLPLVGIIAKQVAQAMLPTGERLQCLLCGSASLHRGIDIKHISIRNIHRCVYTVYIYIYIYNYVYIHMYTVYIINNIILVLVSWHLRSQMCISSSTSFGSP